MVYEGILACLEIINSCPYNATAFIHVLVTLPVFVGCQNYRAHGVSFGFKGVSHLSRPLPSEWDG